MALGARPGDVVRMVIRSGLLLATSGLGIGVAVYLGVGRLLASILYGVSPTDPLSMAVGLAVLLAAALLACWLPAWRASRVDPVEALRAE